MDVPFGAASKIVITYAAVEKKTTGYSLFAQWNTVSAPPSQDYFWMWIIRTDGNAQKLQVASNATSATMEFSVTDASQVYRFSVSDSETEFKQDICTPVQLLLNTFTNLSGEYDGAAVTLKWDKPVNEITFGESLVCAIPDSGKIPYIGGKIERYYRRTVLPIHHADFDAPSAVFISLTPCFSQISSGPPVLSGLFFLTPPKVTDISAAENSDIITLSISFISDYTGTAWDAYVDDGTIMVQPVLLFEGHEVYVGAKKAVKDCTLSGVVRKLDWAISDVPYKHDWQGYVLALYFCTATTRSAVKTSQNTVLLQRPVVGKPCAGRGGIQVSWEYPNSGVAFTVACDNETQTTGKKEILLNQTELDSLDKDITVKPNGRMCSLPVRAFVPGYYPTQNGMRFYSDTYAETKLTVPLGDGFFSAPLTETLSKGPFAIDTNGVLTITKSTALTRTYYDEWIDLLISKNMTPSGYYRMRQWAARLACETGSDSLYYYCGITDAGRSADLIPGAALDMQTASYQFQAGDMSGENAGMVLGGGSRYTVALRELGGSMVLSLDSFSHTVQPTWTPFDKPYGNAVQWAGVMDFFLAKLRLPFARICYPQCHQLSNEPHSFFNADNVVLLFAATLEQLNTASKTLLDTPASAIAIPHIIGRGRADMRLFHTVLINKKPLEIPVGTTFAEAIHPYTAKWGTIPFAGIKLWRWGICGLAEVHLPWFNAEQIDSIALLDGDSIEVG